MQEDYIISYHQGSNSKDAGPTFICTNGETNKIYKCACPQGFQSTIEQTIKTANNIWILTNLIYSFNFISGKNYKNVTLGKRRWCMFEELNPWPWIFQGTSVTSWTGWGKGKTKKMLENHVCWKGGKGKGWESKRHSISYLSLLPLFLYCNFWNLSKQMKIFQVEFRHHYAKPNIGQSSLVATETQTFPRPCARDHF